MADKVYTKTGALGDRTEMPALSYDKDKGSELGYRSDEKALYIGTKDGNVRLCGADDIARIESLINTINARLDALTPSE